MMVERKRASRDRYDSDEDRDRSDSKRRKSGHILKMLCPYYIAGAVIGKGGEKIREVKDRSGAAIEISRHDSRFPNTDERVIALQGERDELQAASRYLNESMRDGDSNASTSARHNDYESERRRRSCKILVADSSMAMIIGKGGDNIRDIKKEFAVQINTSKRNETPRSLDERIITIEGDERDVDRCLDELICLICTDDRSKMRFSVEYADLRHFGRSSGGGGGGGGGGPSRYRERNRSRSRDRRTRSRSKERRRSPRSPSYGKKETKRRSRTPRSTSRSRSR